MTGCLLQLSATIRKILNSSDNCDEQSDLLYAQPPHQVLKCGDLVFEHLVKQLEVVVVDDDIAKKVGISVTAVQKHVNKLKSIRLLDREGSASHGHWIITEA